MGLTGLLLIGVLSLVLLTSAKHIPRVLEQELRHHRGQEQLWLEDYERLSQDQVRPAGEMQADAPPPGTPGAAQVGCPPPDPDEEQRCDVDAPKCVSDDDCKNAEKCCYNPCTNGNTCRVFPAVVDWIREPRRKEEGNSWLIETDGEEDEYPYDYEDDPDWCSTTPPDEDEDALLCPHGYVCQIEFPGDPTQDVPNRGKCIQDDSHINELRVESDIEEEEDLFSNNDLESSRAGQRGQDIRQILPRELLDSGVCVYENSIITEGKTFAYHGLPCKCRDGNIVCRVARPRFPVSNFR